MTTGISSGFFWFTHTVGKGRDSLCIAFAYKQPGKLRSASLDSLVPQICHRPVIPDALVLFSLKGDEPNLDSQIKGAKSRSELERIRGRIALFSATYCPVEKAISCDLAEPGVEALSARLHSEVVSNVSGWLKSGLSSIFQPEKILLTAPPGYTYLKPSGGESTRFLRPDLALDCSPSVEFVALAVLNKVAQQHKDAANPIRTIFIDTMAIAPIAYCLRDLIQKSNSGSPVQIESFHSYEGLDEVPRPVPGESICLISASLTMDLHARWVKEKQVNADDVMTLVTSKPPPAAGNFLFAVDCGEVGPRSEGPGTAIRFQGESFLPEIEHPRKVLITTKDFENDSDVGRLCQLAGRGIFDLYRRDRAGSSARALFVSGLRLIEDEEFRKWFDSALDRSLRATTTAVIYQDDEASLVLARRIQARLGGDCRLLSAQSLQAESLGSDAVVVCAAVIGKGSSLLQVSRDLRDIHSGHRLYLVGYQVSEYRHEIDTLDSNLRFAGDFRHEVLRFAQASIGTPLLASFAREVRQLLSRPGLDGLLPDEFARRLDHLSGTDPLGEKSIWPKSKDMCEFMKLRQSFAFWKSVPAGGACVPEAIGTVASILQRAREDRRGVSPSNQLWSARYRQVMLDPQIFSRFNDGVLQSAFLRCASVGELDYRADAGSSEFVRQLISRLLKRSDVDAGESLLEFLVALALRKLQIRESDLRETVRSLREHSFASAEVGRCVSFMADVIEGRTGTDEPTVF